MGTWIALGIVVVLLLVVVYDLTQKKHAIIRNFPIIGHFRYWLEAVGPELRQYIVTSNDEERPFNRDQRRWVYASSKRENNYFGFGTDNDPELAANYIIIRHSAFPITSRHPGDEGYDASHTVPCAKVLGAARGRKHAFRPRSVVNVSAMSFGSLSAQAVMALNRGAQIAGCLHNTGEGGISDYHRQGGELIWQLGTGYFGARDEQGRFDMARFVDTVASAEVRAIEIKLSQGAKPGMGGLLPAAKVTPEIARIRGIPLGRDCASPAGHSAFGDVDSMLDFVESLADATGLPIGIKSAVGDEAFFAELADQMERTGRGVDFITVDGGEGGTGAAPLVFSDHVALPFKLAMSRVYRVFHERGLQQKVVFVGSGRLGFPAPALLAMGLGCDLIHVAREAMLSIGCIQTQRCHTGHCPTGVATQSRWLARGLDPTLKSHRLANYVMTLRKELMQLAHACGRVHPALVPLEQIDILDDRFRTDSATHLFGYAERLERLSEAQRGEIVALMRGEASA
jgi:glutamate synthase (ferredoxin)